MPGMELTCKDSAQALILFDANFTKILFGKVRNILKLNTSTDDLHPVGIRVKPLILTLEEIQPALEEDAELKGKFIIFPNATLGGHKHIMADGYHMRFTDMPYVGVYLDKKYLTDLYPKTQKQLTGKSHDWVEEFVVLFLLPMRALRILRT
ncbi:MAG: hypothetical protein WKG07_13665 [Hymenobacter sp.]